MASVSFGGTEGVFMSIGVSPCVSALCAPGLPSETANPAKSIAKLTVRSSLVKSRNPRKLADSGPNRYARKWIEIKR